MAPAVAPVSALTRKTLSEIDEEELELELAAEGRKCTTLETQVGGNFTQSCLYDL